ncbi:hypothetical protein ABPG75_001569 [Micractinium tetrahymenae]
MVRQRAVRGRLRLHKAAGRAELAWARAVLEGDPSQAAALDARLATPLHYAAAGWRSLHSACLHRPPRLLEDGRPAAREAVIRLLIAAAPNRAAAVDSELQTPLHRAAGCGHEGALRLLLAAAPVAATMPDIWGNLPLHLAARLHLAAAADEASALSLLAEAPSAAAAPAGERSPHPHCLPLHVAARFGRRALVAALLEAAPEAAAKAAAGGELPLHCAAAGREEGHPAVRSLLLSAAPGAATALGKGCTPLHRAAIEGNASSVAQLLAAAPQAAAIRSSWDAIPLQLALRPRTLEGPDGLAAARLLLAAGPGEAAAEALARAVRNPCDTERALRLLPELVARWALPPAAWAELPGECAGLEAALPAVLARSEGEAALLVGRLPGAAADALRARALCLARLQRRTAVLLPVPALRHILSLALPPPEAF